jgi:hypothetical protein
VVGDSLAAGSEVNDNESWPARLETLAGEPVVNAAVGGWGVDQMVLRSEQLLPLIKPHTIILSTQDQGILRVGYSAFGAPKPYFTLDKGQLVAHNQPVPRFEPGKMEHSLAVRALSHSYVAARIMARLDPDYLPASDGSQFKRISIDEARVSCALLSRFKAVTDVRKTRAALVLQYAWQAVRVAGGAKPLFAGKVAYCAKELGFDVVDTFAPLRQIAERNAAELGSLYIKGAAEDSYSHMSAKGNGMVAQLIAAALARPAEVAAESHQSQAQRSGDGINRISEPENLRSDAPHVELTAVEPTASTGQQPRRYRLQASGPDGEHFLLVAALTERDPPASTYTLSLAAKAGSTGRLRLQLLDNQRNGASVDFDLRKGRVSPIGLRPDIKAAVEMLPDGWYRLSVTATLPESGARAVVQLLTEKWLPAFPASGQSVLLSALKLEIGDTASPYRLER